MIDEERQHDFVDAPQPMQRNAFGHQRSLSKEQIHQNSHAFQSHYQQTGF